MDSETSTDALFLELGKALYVFQSIEARLKFLLPHLVVNGTDSPAKGEGWHGRLKYWESKEMLGNLVRLLQERMSVDEPEKFEFEWRMIVQGRNDVVHNFALQPFAGCTSREDSQLALEYVRARRLRALPMLYVLDAFLRGFVEALQLPPEFEGAMTVELSDWWPSESARSGPLPAPNRLDDASHGIVETSCSEDEPAVAEESSAVVGGEPVTPEQDVRH